MRYLFVFMFFLVNTTQLLSVEDEMFYSTYSTWKSSAPAWGTSRVLGSIAKEQNINPCQGGDNANQSRLFQFLSTDKLNFLRSTAQFLKRTMGGRFFSYAYAYAMTQAPESDPKKLLGDWYKNSGRLKLDTAVVVVGNTKSGKSTTIASLLGAKLEEEHNKKIKLHPSERHELYPGIGRNVLSHTTYPEFFPKSGHEIEYPEKTNLIFVDCPGINDNRSPDSNDDEAPAYDDNVYDMIRDATFECTIRSIENPKLMVVVGYDELTAAGALGFRNFVSYFAPLFRPSVLGSALWVITKSQDQSENDVLDIVQHLEDTVSRRIRRKERMAGIAYSMEPGEQQQKFLKQLENLKYEKKMLESMKNNLILFHPRSDESRDKLLKSLENLPVTPKDEFKFNEESQRSFVEFSNKIIQQEVYPTLNQLFEAQRNTLILTNEIKFGEMKILQKPLGNENMKEIIRSNIAENGRILNELYSQKNQVVEEIASKDSGKEVCIFETHFTDVRDFFDLWTVKNFTYRGSPIVRHEVTTDSHGKFYHWELVKADHYGSLEAKYKGGWGTNSLVDIKLYGLFSKQIHIVGLKNLLEEKKKSLEGSIKDMEDKITILEQDLKNPEHLTIPELQKEVNKWKKEKASLEEKIQSINRKAKNNRYFYDAIYYMRGQFLKERDDLDKPLQKLLDMI